MAILRTYVIPAVVLLGILIAWDFTKPRRPADFYEPPASVRSSDHPPPMNANEARYAANRDRIRKSAASGLDRAWSTFCTAEGRKSLAQAVTYYFEMRGNEEESYEKRWGDEGRIYIRREWATTEDKRIEQLVADTYERGYFDLASVKPFIAKRMAWLINDVRVKAAPCARAG